MCTPVNAGNLLFVELDFFEECAADSVKKVALDSALEPVRINDETAVMRAHHTLDPDAPRLTVHFHLHYMSDSGANTVCICKTATCEDTVCPDIACSGAWSPTVSICRGFNDGNRSSAPEGRVILLTSAE